MYVIGEGGLLTALHLNGCVIDEKTPDYVVVGEGRVLNFEMAEKALRFLTAGAKLVATNLDPNCPTEQGLRPGCGAIVALLESASGLKAFSVGKPSPVIMRMAEQELLARGPIDQVTMVGDTMETDIVGGLQMGYRTVLVLSGSTTTEALERYAYAPTEVVTSIADLVAEAEGTDKPAAPAHSQITTWIFSGSSSISRLSTLPCRKCQTAPAGGGADEHAGHAQLLRGLGDRGAGVVGQAPDRDGVDARAAQLVDRRAQHPQRLVAGAPPGREQEARGSRRRRRRRPRCPRRPWPAGRPPGTGAGSGSPGPAAWSTGRTGAATPPRPASAPPSPCSARPPTASADGADRNPKRPDRIQPRWVTRPPAAAARWSGTPYSVACHFVNQLITQGTSTARLTSTPSTKLSPRRFSRQRSRPG